ncbi:hypothetical protein [uncultured Bacteroides sp.]|uniref:hypothetical protein n=1 Tax=uncultured Bacteroides sp. TaxID=162156 RepID=UPI00260D3A4E|nr:hypothetical protein [uncultured Bacteroides sp.]
MNLYELSNRFWQENEYEPFSVSEVALYFYLLHRANSRRWQMPMQCPTAMICCHLKTSRQNIVKSRESLRRRGFLSFTPGKGKDAPSLYTIVVNPDPLSAPLSDELSGQLSDKMTNELTGELPHELSDKVTVYNNKDKEIDKDIHNNNNKAGDKINEKVGLGELEQRFISDTDWQQSLLPLLSDKERPKIEYYIHEFFQSLKMRGFENREEKDCRNHFYNWLKKQKTNSNGTDKQSNKDRRRGAGVPTASPEDYEGAF